MSKDLPSFGDWLRKRNRAAAAEDASLELRDPPAPLWSGSRCSPVTDIFNPALLPAVSRNNERALWDWVLQASAQAILIIDAASEKVVVDNPAAAALLGAQPEALAGSRLHEVFDEASAPALRTSLASARREGRATVSGRTFCGAELDLSISLFQTQMSAYFIVNVALQAKVESGHAGPSAPSAAFCALDDAAVAFLVTDSSFQVQYANRGFLALINPALQPRVSGTPLLRWLGLSSAQLSHLGEQFQSRRAIGDLLTTLRIEHEAPRPVAVSVVAVPDGPTALWGFCIREASLLH